jgi:hypothetical protein
VEQWNHDGGSGQNNEGRLEESRIEVRVQASVSQRHQEAVERLRHKARGLHGGKVP